VKNLAFLKAKLWDTETRTLHHRWRDGERDAVQLLSAYASLLSGLLDLYEASLDSACLEFGLELAETMLSRFHDADAGGFWQSPGDASDLILRVKEDYDGAEPSGNSVAILALLRLAAITGRTDLKQKAEQSLRRFAERLQELPEAVPHLLLALDYYLAEPRRVVIVGDPASLSARRLLEAAHAVYQPNKVVLGHRGPVEPFARSLPADSESAVAYCCTGTACQAPTKDPERVQKFLRG
jgi:uncharacterized protein YyaL (SSP411 family)